MLLQNVSCSSHYKGILNKIVNGDPKLLFNKIFIFIKLFIKQISLKKIFTKRRVLGYLCMHVYFALKASNHT